MKITNKIFWLFLLTFFIACSTPTEEQTNKQKTAKAIVELPKVAIYKIKPDTFYSEIISNGKLQAINKAELKFKISERLKKIYLHNNQKVKINDKIAELDNSLQKLNLEEALNNLQEAELALQTKIIEYGYNYKKTENIPKDIYKILKIKSGYNKAKTQYDKAQLDYNYTILYSPINGIIANLQAKQYNYINSGDIFCTVIDNSVFETTFTVLENEVAKIKKGYKVSINTFLQNKTYQGVITEINPQVNKDGLVTVKAKVINTTGELIDGMNTQIIVKLQEKNSLVIPKEAVVNRSNRKVVFTYEKGRAKWNYVTITGENSKYYNIGEGLNIGDSVIVEGNLNLAHDTKVELIKDSN